MCVIAAFMGDKVFTIAVVAITGIKTFFLSPSFAILRAGEAHSDLPMITLMALLALAAPIAAIFAGTVMRAKDKADGPPEAV